MKSRFHRPPRLLAAVTFSTVAFLAVTAVPAPASTTKTFDLLDPATILKGTLENTAYSSTGALSLGPMRSATGIPEKEIWDSAVGRDGDVIFVTGSGAALYRAKVLPGAGPAAARPPEMVFGAPEIAFTSLVEAPDGTVYAGSLPSGRIYAVDRTGQGKVFATLPTPYVWCLALAADGVLYAGTGPEAVIYKITPDGHVNTYFDARDSHILSMTFDRTGHLWASTAGHGLVFDITGDGRGRVALNLEDKEARALTFHGDVLYLAANASPPTGGGGTESTGGRAVEFAQLGRSLTGRFDGLEYNQGPDGAAGEAGGSPLLRYSGAEGASVVALYPDGRHETIHSIKSGYLMDVEVDVSGRLWLAVGGEGQLLMVERPDRWTVIHSDPGSSVSSLAMAPAGLAMASLSNPGSVVLFAPGVQADSGSYLTPPLDAGVSTRWGLLHGQLAGMLGFEARSGTTPRPDGTWSPWVAVSPADLRRGGITAFGPIQSPPGRYLQLRTRWSGATAQVKGLRVYYINQNQRPEIESFEVAGPAEEAPAPAGKPAGGAPGDKGLTKVLDELIPGRSGRKEGTGADEKPAESQAAREQGKPAARRTAVSLRWKAKDQDGDEPAYRLWFQPVPEDRSAVTTAPWLPMTPREPVKATTYEWSTDSVPDGRYRVKLEATDEGSNPPDGALKAEREISGITVDNTRPRVLDLVYDRTVGRLSGVATDDFGPVRTLEYQVDGQEWRPFLSQDGILDSPDERFSTPVPELTGPGKEGAHTVVVRARDEAGNIGTGILTLR